MTDDSSSLTKWVLAVRAKSMNPSALREILKITEQPGITNFAGGLPSPVTFPVKDFAAACEAVLKEQGAAALQYSASEGYAPLREKIAAGLPWTVDPSHIIVTTGSQQGLDLIAKVLIDAGSKVLVERPTYLGALQAMSVMEPDFCAMQSDSEGVDPQNLTQHAADARAAYIQPNFQNPTGRVTSAERRKQICEVAERANLPLIEDNPYGDLWFEEPAPPALASYLPQRTVYLGTLSKILSPGIRLGYVVAPKALFPKLLQAKQAADLHTSTFDQRVAERLLDSGFMASHIQFIRALYRQQRDIMLAALKRELTELGVTWSVPKGGMFVWGQLPEGLNSSDLLPKAIERGVAFVPGAPFFISAPECRAFRLSFVTASESTINIGIAKFAAVIRAELCTR